MRRFGLTGAVTAVVMLAALGSGVATATAMSEGTAFDTVAHAAFQQSDWNDPPSTEFRRTLRVVGWLAALAFGGLVTFLARPKTKAQMERARAKQKDADLKALSGAGALGDWSQARGAENLVELSDRLVQKIIERHKDATWDQAATRIRNILSEEQRAELEAEASKRGVRCQVLLGSDVNTV